MSNLFSFALASATNPTDVSITDSLLIAVIGFVIVFAVLIFLMFVIWLMGEIFKKSPEAAAKFKATKFGGAMYALPDKIKSIGKKKAAEQQPVAATVTAVEQELAIGTCGELKLVKTSERDAAMIMAIVADATETPLNELRFKSIKYIGEGEEK